MAFHNRNYILNLFVSILIFLTSVVLSMGVKNYKRSRFDLPERFVTNLASKEYSPLIEAYKPLELNLGAPGLLPPPFLQDSLTNITRSKDTQIHQYFSPEGSLELRTEIAAFYSPLINQTLNPKTNVVVTLGALEALYLTLLVYTLPGDEWIVIEPAFEHFFYQIKITGGTRTTGSNKTDSADLVFDRNELRNAFNAKTKGIIVNNPNNPTGKIFTKEELLFIAKLAIKWDTLIISDEVYEWSIYDPKTKLIRMASLGNEIYRRTITLLSMSKTYFVTGWRVGWAIGPSKLIQNLVAPQPFIAFSLTTYQQVMMQRPYSGTNLKNSKRDLKLWKKAFYSCPQLRNLYFCKEFGTSVLIVVTCLLFQIFTRLASAEGLRKMRYELSHPSPDSYFNKMVKILKRRRDIMVEALSKIGVQCIVPQSGYFIFANWTALESKSTGLNRENGSFKDIKFINWLIKNAGIGVASGSGCYSGSGKKIGEDFVRICHVKTLETLKRAATSLQKTYG